MRKKFVFFVLIPLLVLLAVLYFFINGWIESGLEYAGEQMNGARVEIDHLALSLSPLRIRLERLQVASTEDSMRNLFETGPIEFRMNLAQLLHGRTIIETMEVNEVILGTHRASSGFLPKVERTAVESPGYFSSAVSDLLKRSAETTPLLDPALWRGSLNLDSLLKAQNFRTLALIDSLQKLFAGTATQWDSTTAAFNLHKKRLEEMEIKLRAIKPSELRSVEEITRDIRTVEEARKTIDGVAETYKQRSAALRLQVEDFNRSIGSLDESVEGDIRQVLSQARLPDLNAMNLAELLLGSTVLSDAKKAAVWIDRGRALSARYKPKPAFIKPPRLRGQDIHFPVKRGYPELWIKNVQISGGTDRAQESQYIHLQGSVQNISSDQRLAGEPLTISLKGTRGGAFSLAFDALLDRRGESTLDQFTARMSGLEVKSFSLGKSDFLPSTISGARLAAGVDVRIPGDDFNVKGSLQFRSMNLVFEKETKSIGERIAREALNGVKGFDAGFRIWRDEKKVDVAFTTDLDDQFVAGLKRVAGTELVKIQNQIRSRVTALIAARRSDLEHRYTEKRDETLKQAGALEEIIKQKKTEIEDKKRELEARLEKVKKGALDKAVKTLLK